MNVAPLPFTPIDLETHPDGKLLGLCAKMTDLQDRWDHQWSNPKGGVDEELCRNYWDTANKLMKLHPRTRDGFHMKAMIALGMLTESQQRLRKMTQDGGLSCWGPAVAIVNDVIRGMPV